MKTYYSLLKCADPNLKNIGIVASGEMLAIMQNDLSEVVMQAVK
jgi:hypothetical protein